MNKKNNEISNLVDELISKNKPIASNNLGDDDCRLSAAEFFDSFFKEKSKNKTLVVNLFGGPGTGKSTIRAGIFHDLKWAGVECEEAYEYAKDLVWEKSNSTFQDQIFLFANQYHRIFRLIGQVDVVVTDCPILLSPVYDLERRKTLEQLVVDEHNRMWTYNVFLQREKEYKQKGRLHSESEAKKLDKEIMQVLIKHNIPYETFAANRVGKNHIVKNIMRLLPWRRQEFKKR